jgi:hypothetical protein
MKPARLLRWYPRAWRERYGEELLALIQDTLDEGRPTWRLRLGVVTGGLRERVHQAVRAGTSAAKRTATGWLITAVAAMILGSLPWDLKAALPVARAWQKTASFDLLVGGHRAATRLDDLGAAWQAADRAPRSAAAAAGTPPSVPASLRGGMILVSPTIDSVREERPGFRSGRS